MADGGSNAKDQRSGAYDPRNDASWQARLEEARAKRERVLSQRPSIPRRKKRLKPWEEEGVILVDEEDSDFVPGQTGLEFAERVDAMRARSKPVEPEQVEPVESEKVEQGTAERAPPIEQKRPTPSKKKYTRLVDPERAEPLAPKPEAQNSAYSGHALDDVFTEPDDEDELKALDSGLNLVSRPPMNRVAYDTHGPGSDGSGPSAAEPDYLPIEALRTGPPEPVRPSRVPYVEPQVAPKKPEPAPELENFRKERKPGLWRLLLFFLFAASIGPIYQFTRPYEWGPQVFTLSKFPIEPAFGLTSPLFVVPPADSLSAWKPPSVVPPAGPLRVAKPSVPVRTEKVGGLFGAPGESEMRMVVGAGFAESPRLDAGASATLPDVSVETRFWPESTLTILDYCCTGP